MEILSDKMKRITIAIDAMGGDKAPHIVIEGAAQTLEDYPDLSYMFFGDENVITPLIQYYPLLAQQSTIHHTDKAITNDMKPAEAFSRSMHNTSMRQAIEAVANKKADAVVSAGNTGAYMGLLKLILKNVKGINRPAIAGVIPTLRGKTVLIDLGANVNCTPHNLIQFALMGEIFARQCLSIVPPSVGLLNMGWEEYKGNIIIQEAHQILKNTPTINYFGFVEGDDITKGTTDVIVTDGFTGNIALKSIEGEARFLHQTLTQSLENSISGKIAYLIGKNSFKKVKQNIDPSNYNGAPFLGIQGVAIKSHGAANSYAFSKAIRIAINMIRQNLNQEIENCLTVL